MSDPSELSHRAIRATLELVPHPPWLPDHLITHLQRRVAMGDAFGEYKHDDIARHHRAMAEWHQGQSTGDPEYRGGGKVVTADGHAHERIARLHGDAAAAHELLHNQRG